ncbi:MAG: RNA 2',3'-cyclic phosphodiesterase [bacterium]|nr:RNA 2',3'-cyclic phosphodiesterase [bacterium]
MRRLFIAINLPENIKEAIEEIVNDLKISMNQHVDQLNQQIEIRFLPKENWHLTISFLGYQPIDADLRGQSTLTAIIESIKEAAKKFSAAKIEFKKIMLAPPNKSPRMIWLSGTKETSKILGVIKTKLENELIKNRVQFKKENRGFNCHLTLARFPVPLQKYENIRLSKKLIPRLGVIYEKQLPISFDAQSLDLMESRLKRTGAKYEILASISF